MIANNVVFFTSSSSSTTVTITKIICGMSYIKVQQISRKRILYTIAKIAKEINIYMKKRFCVINFSFPAHRILWKLGYLQMVVIKICIYAYRSLLAHKTLLFCLLASKGLYTENMRYTICMAKCKFEAHFTVLAFCNSKKNDKHKEEA